MHEALQVFLHFDPEGIAVNGLMVQSVP